MSYQSTLTNLRDQTEKDVLTAWRMYGLGRIDKARFTQFAAALINQANGRAVAVADLALSAELTSLMGNVRLPYGTLPDAYGQERLQKGVRTLLEAAAAGDDITERLARFARSEPLTAATNAYSHGVSTAKGVTGWVRQMDANPCQLCRWWWREGRVWPASHPMQHHKGCECTQRVVTVKKVKQVAI